MARLALTVAVLLASAVPASASELLLRERVVAPTAADVSCSRHSHPGAGAATVQLRAPAGGYVTARLTAPSGDWDLAVFRRQGGQAVAASAYRGATEVAGGFVRRGDRLTVRACRRSGPARSARVSVDLERMNAHRARRPATLARVHTPTLSSRRRLTGLGLDLTERGDANFVWVVLHGARDAAGLRAAGLSFTTARTRERRVAETAALPSGSTSYRRLADYGEEMKALAVANPDLVKPITLAHKSRQGRPIEGLEITTNPMARDGKPAYLQLGMHHAREWPAAELPLEWAYELIKGYRAGDARTRRLVDSVRTIIVPVVNPDGFNFSREGGELAGHGDGLQSGEVPSPSEDHRKNCPATGCVVNGGVDLNRNYGDLWGGPGSSSSPDVETYGGPAPFSEPEAKSVQELISSRQVVVMITNHTFGNEILRQPGVSSEPVTPDESTYAALGSAMATQNGYSNIFSYQIGYDHVGTTDGWSYYVTGGLGYVFEAGSSSFHPPYAAAVQDYEHGSTPSGGGNREAYYVAMEAAANPALHSVLTGSAPAGSILRLTKSFRNRTWTTATTAEHLETTMEVPASGHFDWHVNQSSRPLVAGERWTLTCERPEGTVLTTEEVAVVRGQSVGLSPCPAGPAPDARAQPRLRVTMVAGVRGRIYRARVKGSLRGVPNLETCDGVIALAILVRSRPVAKRRAGLDERCRFERAVRVPRHRLPKALRGRRAHVIFKAVARWGGNEFLAPAKRSVRARVRRRG
jgi:hypothetical protein